MPIQFTELWKIAKSSVVPHINGRLKTGSLSKTARAFQHIQAYTEDVITAASIRDKVRSILTDLRLQFFPSLSQNSFWGPKQFRFAPLERAKKVNVLQIVNGRPIMSKSKAIDNEKKIQVKF